jgi:hypothetical protein
VREELSGEDVLNVPSSMKNGDESWLFLDRIL